jgi:hypothetical protein
MSYASEKDYTSYDSYQETRVEHWEAEEWIRAHAPERETSCEGQKEMNTLINIILLICLFLGLTGNAYMSYNSGVIDIQLNIDPILQGINRSITY